MNQSDQRRTLERNVALAGNSIPYANEDLLWLQGEDFEAFIGSLYELLHYYDENWDESIIYVSVEVLNVYFLAIHALMGVLLSPHRMNLHQAARESLAALEAWMDDVIGLGYAYLNGNE